MNHKKKEIRNSRMEIGRESTTAAGVGGRHEDLPLAGGVGGYQDICNEIKVTLRDLRQILRSPLLEAAAEKIGADNFVELWRMVDRLENDGAWLRLPSFSRMERHYRDKMIQSMHEDGRSPSEIKNRLDQVGIALSLRRIHAILQSTT